MLDICWYVNNARGFVRRIDNSDPFLIFILLRQSKRFYLWRYIRQYVHAACLSLIIWTSIIDAQALKYFLFKWDMCRRELGTIPSLTSSRANKRVKRGNFESLKQVVASRFDGNSPGERYDTTNWTGYCILGSWASWVTVGWRSVVIGWRSVGGLISHIHLSHQTIN